MTDETENAEGAESLPPEEGAPKDAAADGSEPASAPPETLSADAPAPADAASDGSAPAAPAEPEKIAIPPGIESILPDDVPKIQLAAFEGPLDLLLYLIRRERIDIHNLPIAPITRMYMEYLDLMRELNLELAGEFMVMAATLIHIKSKMLVPISPTEAEGEEELEDPRDELIQRLLEFERYKEAAGILHQRREIRAATWTRPEAVIPVFDDAGEEMLEAGLFDLIAAFKELLERRRVFLAHEVETEGPPLEERMDQLLAMIKEGESLEFLALFETLETKPEMIVTFLALLELIRLKRIKVYQRGIFGPIRVFRPVGPQEGPTPLAPPPAPSSDSAAPASQ